MIHRAIFTRRNSPTSEPQELARVAICDKGQSATPQAILAAARSRLGPLSQKVTDAALYGLQTAKRAGTVTPTRTVSRWVPEYREGVNAW